MKSYLPKIILSCRQIFFIIVLSSVIVTGLYFLLKKPSYPHSVTDESIFVEATPVTEHSIAIEAHAVGTMVAAQTVQITPEIAGQVARIFFRDGAFVKKGTLLIQLNDASLKAQVASDKANLIYSEVDYQRKEFLGKKGAISKQAIDAALAEMKTKQAALAQSQVNLDKMQLLAPFEGVLGQAKVSEGAYVNAAEPIVALTDIEHLHVEYAVAEKYFSALKLGQKVTLTTRAYPDQEFSGTVAFISPTINPDDRTISVYANVPNDKRLLTAGLFVTITQELGQIQNALLIPASSLVSSIDGQYVYKIVDHKVFSVPVVLGQRMQNTVQITSGLSAKDQVVIAGQEKLKEGVKVKTS